MLGVDEMKRERERERDAEREMQRERGVRTMRTRRTRVNPSRWVVVREQGAGIPERAEGELCQPRGSCAAMRMPNAGVIMQLAECFGF